jgi:hypothetical protein
MAAEQQRLHHKTQRLHTLVYTHPLCLLLHYASCHAMIAAVLQAAATGSHAVRLVSAAAGDAALQAAILHHKTTGSMELLLLLWQALLDSKLLGASQEPYWPLISYIYSNFTQHAIDHLQSLPVKLPSSMQLYELVPVGKQLKLVIGSADVPSLQAEAMQMLWSAAGPGKQHGVVQRHKNSSSGGSGGRFWGQGRRRAAFSMHKVAVDAYVLPWGDIGDTSLRGQPSLLRMLVKGRHPTAVYNTIAGGWVVPASHVSLVLIRACAQLFTHLCALLHLWPVAAAPQCNWGRSS